MSAAERGIRLAVATLPAPMRERYREQWLADVRDAGELGLSRLAIVVGAFTFSLGLGRTAEMRGFTVTELMVRRVRWGMALVVCSPVMLVTLWVSGTPSASPGSLMSLLVGLFTALSVAVLAFGLALLVVAARSANRLALIGTAMMAFGLLGIVIPAVLAAMLPAFGAVRGFLAVSIPLCLLLAAVGAMLGLTGFLRGLADVELPTRAAAGATDSGTRARAGVFACLGLAWILAFGTYEALVLSPMAQVPGYSLSEIYAALTPADRSSGIAMVVVWLIFWGLVVLALLVLCLLRGRLARALNVLLTPRRLLVYTLLLGSVIIFFQGWSGFSIGMSIADTIPDTGGGRSGQGTVLTFGGMLMFVAGVLLALVPGPRRALVPVASAA